VTETAAAGRVMVTTETREEGDERTNEEKEGRKKEGRFRIEN
jgi:hypothetical protein